MRKISSLGVAVAFLFVSSSAALACEGPGGCAGKDAAKCGAKEGAVLASAKECKEGTACQKLTALKEGGKCCAQPSICAEKAQSLAVKVRSENCPVQSASILAKALPQIQCETARAKLVADVKAKGCEKEAGQAILAALKDLNPPAAPTAAKEGAPGCCAKEGAALAKAGATGSCAKEGGKQMAASFCPLKAEKLASAIRAEGCCDRSAAILAEALPGLSCKETLAKLVSEIKSSDCAHEGAEVILAASAKLVKKVEPAAAN